MPRAQANQEDMVDVARTEACCLRATTEKVKMEPMKREKTVTNHFLMGTEF